MNGTLALKSNGFTNLDRDEMLGVDGGTLNIGNFIIAATFVYGVGYALGVFVGNIVNN